MGKEKNPLFKGKARRKSKINRKNPFPADGTLRLGLISSQTRIRKSALELQINHNKQYKKSEKRKKKGGKRRLRIVTPLHR